MKAFLDTNIPMYAAGAKHPAKRPCLELLRKVTSGEVDAVTDVEVFQEILHRFSAIGRVDEGSKLFGLFERVVRIVLPIDFHDVSLARQILLENPKVTARDAIHVAVMRKHGISVMFSYDRHFDDIPGIERREP